MNEASIRAAIVSVQDFAPHQNFFAGPLGMTIQAQQSYDEQQTTALLGVTSTTVDTIFLQQAPTEFGIRLWRLDPSNEPIRCADQGTDTDALKVVDFYTPDFAQSLATLSANGYQPKSDIAEYQLPEGHFLEAHYWLPDNLVCAAIAGPEDFMKRFASITDRQFSEPQSISAPVSNAEQAIDFYRQVFGLEALYRYQINNPSFDAMVGANQPLKLSAVNMGTDLQTPYLGIIDYGQSGNLGVSLRGKSRPPARGLLGVELLVEDIEQTLAASERFAGTSNLTSLTELEYPPYGVVRSTLIEGPHGVIHHVIQQQ